jgi:hypothetical protein
MGHHFGVPFHHELQRRIILFALEHLAGAKQSDEVSFFPMTRSQARQEAKKLGVDHVIPSNDRHKTPYDYRSRG